MKRILLRIYHFFQRIIRGLRKIPKNIKEFNWEIAVSIFIDGLIPPEKSEKYIEKIFSYVNEYEKPIVEQYFSNSYNSNNSMVHSFDKVPVWCCWWQGEENMPELVSMCNNRLKHVLPDYSELHMITENNYSDYIDLPLHVFEKFHAGNITITTLSDIIRFSLLSKYGGCWIDATVFVSASVFPDEFLSRDFFAQCMGDTEKWIHEACKGRWCGFLISGSKDNIFFQFVRDAFFFWWENHNDIIDYVLIDYLMLVAYNNLPDVKKMVDNLPPNNIDIFEMYKVLHLEYNEDLWNHLTANTVMHKLTYKMDLKKQTDKGKGTIYQHLLEKVDM